MAAVRHFETKYFQPSVLIRPQQSLNGFHLNIPHMLWISTCFISTVDFTVLCFMVTHLPVAEVSLRSVSPYLGATVQQKQ
jgi:hypothetical protein